MPRPARAGPSPGPRGPGTKKMSLAQAQVDWLVHTFVSGHEQNAKHYERISGSQTYLESFEKCVFMAR